MESKLVAIPDCVTYVDAVVANGTIKFVFLDDAPFWIKVISNGSYCACGDTVYVPIDHLKLASSIREKDRTIATAKLLPWVMALRDGHLTSVWKTWMFLKNYKLTSQYFIYEYGFLRLHSNSFSELILTGFIASRRSFFGRKIKPEYVIDHMKQFLQ